jgi:hypothetical protein
VNTFSEKNPVRIKSENELQRNENKLVAHPTERPDQIFQRW